MLVWVLIWVFLWSGVTKINKPAYAAMAMVHFEVVRHFRPVFGRLIGCAELMLAIGLVYVTRLSLFIAAVILWVFAGLLGRSIYIGKRFACGCFGDTDEEISILSFTRTIILALLASILVMISAPFTRSSLYTSILTSIVALSIVSTIIMLATIRRLIWGTSRRTE